MTAAQNPLTPGPVTIASGSHNLETPERALAIGAHPDDVDFGCGATLAKWAADGCQVHILVCTDGSKGTWDPNADDAELIATRQQEQHAAAKILGACGEIGFLGWPDGELESTLVQRAQVAEFIRRTRPSVVLGHDPWKPYRLHPDHRHAGWLVTDGVVAARDPKFFPDQDVPHHRPDLLLLWETDSPDHVEDVSGFADAKIAALLAHESQFETTMAAKPNPALDNPALDNPALDNPALDNPALDDFKARVRAKLEVTATAAQSIGLTMKEAEAFKLIDDL